MAKNFREIFGELAPGGRGELVMQKRLRPDPQEQEDPEEDEDGEPASKADAMERYAGVKVKVCYDLLYCFHDLCLTHLMHVTKRLHIVTLSLSLRARLPCPSLCLSPTPAWCDCVDHNNRVSHIRRYDLHELTISAWHKFNLQEERIRLPLLSASSDLASKNL